MENIALLLAAAPAGGAGNGLIMVALYAVIILGAWFLLIRPQRKERKRLDAMFAEMAIGDTVVTTSGFYGVIIDIQDDDVIIEFGNNKNCRIPMKRNAIAQIEKADNAE